MAEQSRQKLLFFDIDGTLLAGGISGYVPDSTLRALRMAQEKGHYVLVNTGRTYSYMPTLMRKLPFDGYICGCGTQIFLNGREIYRNIIPANLRRNVISYFDQANLQGVFEGTNHCYFSPNTDNMASYIAFIQDAYDKLSPTKTFDDQELDYDKFVILYDENSDLPLFKELIKEDFDFIDRGSIGEYGFAEIVPAGHSKATGIDIVTKKLGLTLDDCYVFGDSTNDLPMLNHVKHSIAMGNSDPEVLKVTEYVTTPVNRDGIYLAMKHYNLI